MAPEIRPLEPSDARAAFELVSSLPGTGRPPGSRIEYMEWYEASFEPPALDRLGAFEGGALVGLVELERGVRPRVAHAARLTFAMRPADLARGAGDALLAAALSAADRWLHLVRTEVELLADDEPAQRLFRSLGFEPEVRRRAAVRVEGGLADTVTLGRIRPGFAQAEGALRPQDAPPPRQAAFEPVVVRPITPADAAALSRFSRDDRVLWGTSQTPTVTVDAWRRRIRGWIASGTWCVVLEAGGEVAACGNLHAAGGASRGHAWILAISVLPPFQGRGIGDRLMRVLLDAADGPLGADRVELTVVADNTRAVALYRKHGFETEGLCRYDVWRDGGYADSLVMARRRPAAAPPASGDPPAPGPAPLAHPENN